MLNINPQPTVRRQISVVQWREEAVQLFGPDPRNWKFQCPHCNEVQTLQEFLDHKIEDADTKAYFSCIGRWVEGRGCKWTLGGLFQIHKTEVFMDEFAPHPVFEFFKSTLINN